MRQALLLYLLVFGGSLAALHLVLSARRRLPLALFCALAAVSSAVTGVAVLHEVLLAQARRSTLAALLWGPGLALGFFAAGALGALAWAGLVTLLAIPFHRLLRRGPREDGAS